MKTHAPLHRLLAPLVLAIAAGAAASQTVWRCGADGRTYTDEPCPDGVVVQVTDARTAAQRLDAERVAAREAALAQRMVRERRHRDATPQAVAGSIGPAAALIKRDRETRLVKVPRAKDRAAAAGRTSPAGPRATRRAAG